MTNQGIKKAAVKVADDYNGALDNWPTLKVWQFVSNFIDGVPPQITQEILRLQALTKERALKQFGKEQFEAHIFDLSLADIESS